MILIESKTVMGLWDFSPKLPLRLFTNNAYGTVRPNCNWDFSHNFLLVVFEQNVNRTFRQNCLWDFSPKLPMGLFAKMSLGLSAKIVAVSPKTGSGTFRQNRLCLII